MMSWLNRIFGTSSPAESPAQLQSVTFSFDKAQTGFLGEIRRPLATVKIWSDVFNEWHKVSMLIDTGADYTLLPQYMSYLFATKRSTANQQTTVGVGGDHQVYFLEKVKVKVGPFERVVPVGISSSNQIPPLMGRHLFFETFMTHFNKNKTIRFSQ
jgi:predicted aspartyl protease